MNKDYSRLSHRFFFSLFKCCWLLLLLGWSDLVSAQAITWPQTPDGEIENGRIGDWADEIRGLLAPNAVDGAASIGVGASIITTDAQGRKSATVSGDLTFDVEGKVGATHYCDEAGANCFTADNVAVLTGSDTSILEIPVYANVAARDGAVTSPTKGDVVYLEDAGNGGPSLQVYNGSAWDNVGALDNAELLAYLTTNNYVKPNVIGDCDANEVLAYNGTVWSCVAPSTLAVTGDGISVNAVLSLEAGNVLKLTDGSNEATLDLTSFLDNTDAQDLALSGDTLSITNDPNTDVDLDAYLTNYLGTDNNYIDPGSCADGQLPQFDTGVWDCVDPASFAGDTDDQTLSLDGGTNILSISEGNNVDLSPYADNTDAQDLTLSSGTLALTGDATTIDLGGYLNTYLTTDNNYVGYIGACANDQILQYDGSDWSCINVSTVGNDDLGDHTATESLKMAGQNIENAGIVEIDQVKLGDTGGNSVHWTLEEDGANGLDIKYNTTQFYIDASGRVGIGVNSGLSEKLEVDGNIQVTTGNDVCIDGGVCLSTITGADNMGNHTASQTLAMADQTITNALSLQLSDEGSDNTGGSQWLFSEASNDSVGLIFGATTKGFTMDTDGNMDVTGYVNTGSDIRYKKNVVTAGGLEIVSQLRGVVFDWRRNDDTSLGVIAQEVEAVVPTLVNTRDDGYKSVNYDGFVALLIEAVKDLEAQNKSLEQRIEALENAPSP